MNGVYGVGTAYRYEFNVGGDSWDLREIYLPPDGFAGMRFGYAVAANLNSTVVTAEWDNFPYANSGSVYLYRFNNTLQWPLHVKLAATDAQADSNLGFVVVAGTKRIIIGTTRINSFAGSVYMVRAVCAAHRFLTRLRSMTALKCGHS